MLDFRTFLSLIIKYHKVMILSNILLYVMLFLGVDLMSKRRFTTYVTEEAYEKVKALSDETRVPIAQYMQEAIEDLLKKYDKLPKK